MQGWMKASITAVLIAWLEHLATFASRVSVKRAGGEPVLNGAGADIAGGSGVFIAL
ncbi:MAG: hypothetical protein R2911_20765 [Caldilineaceae bacterium]